MVQNNPEEGNMKMSLVVLTAAAFLSCPAASAQAQQVRLSALPKTAETQTEQAQTQKSGFAEPAIYQRLTGEQRFIFAGQLCPEANVHSHTLAEYAALQWSGFLGVVVGACPKMTQAEFNTAVRAMERLVAAVDKAKAASRSQSAPPPASAEDGPDGYGDERVRVASGYSGPGYGRGRHGGCPPLYTLERVKGREICLPPSANTRWEGGGRCKRGQRKVVEKGGFRYHVSCR